MRYIKNDRITLKLKRYLLPCKNTLLVNVADPLQWKYIEPCVKKLNRSVTVLFHYDIVGMETQPFSGITYLEMQEITSSYSNEENNSSAKDGNNTNLETLVSICMELMQPEGIIVCGNSKHETAIAATAKSHGISVLQIMQGCSESDTMPIADYCLRWENVGCMLPPTSLCKYNIIGICIRHEEMEAKVRLQQDIINKLEAKFTDYEIWIIQLAEDEVNNNRKEKSGQVRYFNATSWNELLDYGRIIVSDDTCLLSQAAISGCRTILCNGIDKKLLTWNCPMNEVWEIERGEESALLVATEINQHILYAHSETNYVGLNIGCGSNLLDGWMNTDIQPLDNARFMDASKVYPFADETFEYIFSEHLFEHLPLKGALSMLHECYRVLKPGGHIRLTMPDLDFLIRLYQHPEKELHKKYIQWSTARFDQVASTLYDGEDVPAMFVVNNFMRFWGHQMIYNREVMENLLSKAGFKNIHFCKSGESDFPPLQDIERHSMQIPKWCNNLESMTLEGRK